MGDEEKQGEAGDGTTTDVTTPGGTEVHEEQGSSDEPASEPDSDGE